MRCRGMDQILCQEIEKSMIAKWSKPKVWGQQYYGLDKRLLNISKLDGGYGLVINGNMPVRAKVIVK